MLLLQSGSDESAKKGVFAFTFLSHSSSRSKRDKDTSTLVLCRLQSFAWNTVGTVHKDKSCKVDSSLLLVPKVPKGHGFAVGDLLTKITGQWRHDEC